jgi:hypothetical protein
VYDFAGDAISHSMGLSPDTPNFTKSFTVGAVTGAMTPLLLPLDIFASVAGKVVIGGYNAAVSGVGAFGATAITNTGSSPDLSGELGVGTAAAGSFAQYVVPGPAGAALGYMFQIVPGPMQSAIENSKKKSGSK